VSISLDESKVDYDPLTACSAADYDPEWWVHEHSGRCPMDCPHRLALHICLRHCPLLERCRDLAVVEVEVWEGMVMGGMLMTKRRGEWLQRSTPASTCGLCN
jgi:hypothetical protein